MNRLWNILYRPIIEEIHANYIVEIGSDSGINTNNILEYCVENDAHMTAIDPVPKFDIEKFKLEYGDKFEIYTELSLSILPTLEDYDVIIIDGDHNWYTVYNELKTIEKSFENKKFPLIFLHDVGWPYARRDLYYNPENIPEIYRQPYKKLGIYPGQSDLKENGGMNTSLYNSIYENTPKNGVLTAVEDFIKESDLEFNFYLIQVYHGVGILYPKNKKLESRIKNIINTDKLLELLEEERLKLYIEKNTIKTELNGNRIQLKNLEEKSFKTDKKLNQTETELNQTETELNQTETELNQTETELNQTETELNQKKSELRSANKLIRENAAIKLREEQQIKELNLQLNSISLEIYEMKYLSNHGRSIKQILESKLATIYLLTKKKNGSIKNTITNIRGHRAIKRNHLFDIGYYLKNNPDVRISGDDPLMHYIYYGFKEGRNPSPKFDGVYYTQKYADVKDLGINPLIHYSLYGMKEGRKTIGTDPTQNTEKSTYDVTKKFKSLKTCIIQLTPEKTKNPYYTMIGDELISRGINFKYLNDFSSVEKVLKQNTNCIIHLHQPEPYYHSNTDEAETLEKSYQFLDNLKKFKSLGANLVWTMHNPVAHDRRFQKIDEIVNEALFDLSDNIIVLGRNAKETLLKHNVSTPISEVMHPSFKEFYGPKPDKVEARKELGLPTDAMIFGNIGHIKPYKELELIIEAFNNFKNSYNSSEEIFLCIAGSSSNREYIESIKENSTSDILIIDRDLPDPDLIKFVSALDYSIFSFKDIWASSGVVLSLSYGVPVIVPDIGCMSNYIQHLNNGLLYTHNDIDSMIEVFEKAMDLEYYDHLKYMSMAYSEDKTVANVSDEFLEVYSQVQENSNSKKHGE